MKKNIILLGLIILLSFSGKTQVLSYQWAQNMTDPGECLELDNSGFIYAANRISSGGFSITKYNSSSVIQWSISIGTSNPNFGLAEMKIDPTTGNVYVICGMSGGLVDLDPTAATNYVSGGDIVIAKYNASNGNLMWGNSMFTGTGGSYSKQYQHIVVDNSGAAYIASDFYGTVDFDPGPGTYTMSTPGSTFADIYFAKYDSNGNFAWAKQVGNSANFAFDYSSGIEVDNVSGNVYVVGVVNSGSGGGDLDPGPGFVSGSGGFVGKYNGTTGNYIAHRLIPSSSNIETAFDNFGNIYLMSPYNTSVTFDFTLNSGGPTGASNVYLVKLACNASFGQVFGVNILSSINGNKKVGDLAVDNLGNVYTMATQSCTNTIIYFSKHDVNGVTIFNQALSVGTDCTNPNGEGITTNGSDIYISVASNGYTGDYDIGAGTNVLPTAANKGVIAKYNYCTGVPSQPSLISGTSTLCSVSGTQSYSVANVSGASSYSWSLPAGWSGTSSSNTISVTTGTASGNISVTANNACGSSSATILNITINPNPTITVNSGSICFGNTFTIMPSGANTYTFSSGSAVVSPTSTASYSVTGTSTAGCLSASVAVSNITVNALPIISVTGVNAICIGNNTNLTASGANTYTWSTTATTTSIAISPTINTTYTVTGTSAAGCTNVAVKSITVNPLPTITANTSNSIICGPPFQGTATLTAGGASTYTWNTSATTTLIAVSPSVTTTYTLTGTDVNGCVNMSAFTQSVSLCTALMSSVAETSSQYLYPNPTSGIVTVTGFEGTVYVCNTLGEIILNFELSKLSSQLNLSSQPNGIYFIRFGSTTRKIIKQ